MIPSLKIAKESGFELYSQTRDEKYKEFALRLVDQVHNILGRHRDDSPRTGWISGLDEREGKMHPTKGGLRIGKEIPANRVGPCQVADMTAETVRICANRGLRIAFWGLKSSF